MYYDLFRQKIQLGIKARIKSSTDWLLFPGCTFFAGKNLIVGRNSFIKASSGARIFFGDNVGIGDHCYIVSHKRVLERGEIIKLVYAGSAGFGLKDRLDTIVKSVIKFPNMQFDIIGMTQEQYEVGYGHMLERYQNIIFHGRIPHQEAVQAADFQFLIRDSNLKNDAGFPTKFVESLACCTPVIATLTSNIGDYLTDGYNGYVVDDNQTLDEVLQTISQLTKQEIVQMKKHCRKCRLFDYREYKYAFEQIFG